MRIRMPPRQRPVAWSVQMKPSQLTILSLMLLGCGGASPAPQPKLAEDRSLASLTPDEAAGLCGEVFSLAVAHAARPEVHNSTCAIVALGVKGPAPTDAGSAQAQCRERFVACRAAPPATVSHAISCASPDLTTRCRGTAATASQLRGCMDELGVPRIPSGDRCSSLTGDMMQDSMTAVAQAYAPYDGPRCKELFASCPALHPMSDHGGTGVDAIDPQLLLEAARAQAAGSADATVP